MSMQLGYNILLMLKLLIFDLDGTLADTSQDITNALNFALEPFGQRNFSVEETKEMVGSGISSLLASLVPPGGPQDGDGLQPKDLATKRFIEFYTDHVIDHTSSYPHVAETLERLGRYRKVVLSNKREVLSRRVLEGLGLLGFFELVLGSDSVSEKKPSPVPILQLMERFGSGPGETVIIGDSNYDVEAGKAAGIPVIAVSYGFRKRDVLKDADHIIDSFDELITVLPTLE